MSYQTLLYNMYVNVGGRSYVGFISPAVRGASSEWFILDLRSLQSHQRIVAVSPGV